MDMAQDGRLGSGAHIRVHGSILAAAEKRLLVWIARRLPHRLTSDHLSALGLGSLCAAGASLAALPFNHWAAAGFVVSLAANWFGDSLDGTVARVRGHERPRYGYYVDHVIDIAGTSALMAGLACSGLMAPLLTTVVLCAYLLVSAESYLATHSAGVFRLSFMGFGPTELRIVLAIGVLKAVDTPLVDAPLIGHARLFDIGAVAAIVGMAAAFVISAVRTTRDLYMAEPLPSSVKPARAA
jgi:phosphatidylglycerophosphate synthase